MKIYDEIESEYLSTALDLMVLQIKEKVLDKARALQMVELSYGPYIIKYVPFMDRRQYDSGLKVTKAGSNWVDLNDMELRELEAVLKEVSKEEYYI